MSSEWKLDWYYLANTVVFITNGEGCKNPGPGSYSEVYDAITATGGSDPKVKEFLEAGRQVNKDSKLLDAMFARSNADAKHPMYRWKKDVSGFAWPDIKVKTRKMESGADPLWSDEFVISPDTLYLPWTKMKAMGVNVNDDSVYSRGLDPEMGEQPRSNIRLGYRSFFKVYERLLKRKLQDPTSIENLLLTLIQGSPKGIHKAFIEFANREFNGESWWVPESIPPPNKGIYLNFFDRMFSNETYLTADTAYIRVNAGLEYRGFSRLDGTPSLLLVECFPCGGFEDC